MRNNLVNISLYAWLDFSVTFRKFNILLLWKATETAKLQLKDKIFRMEMTFGKNFNVKTFRA